MMQQKIGAGYEGSKGYKGSTEPGSPGAVVNPAAKSADQSDFGWKALDYKYGDKPLYQMMKGAMQNKQGTGNFCGHQQGGQGMQNPSAAAAMAAKPYGGAMPAGQNPGLNDMPEGEAPPVDTSDFGGEMMG